ncbi:MAG: folylpolyglutamate synthase/dihydrofolate synthase family protein [Ginsengibacter sp.]
MTYEQTLHYLYNKLPLFSNIGLKAYKADLKNTLALCKYLGDPQNKIKTIHIAGTNGKGSTSHMLAAVFQQAGYKTGLYTSPHLKDFRERIKINGSMVEKSFVVDFVKKMNIPATEISPSFFELTFVMALEYFMQQHVDIAVIETGLGGRLDSTNVITPEISVITNIGYDHMDILGDTIEKIAAEKAGIIKKGVPVVIGETVAETKLIFKKIANKLNAPIFFAEENLHVVSVSQANEKLAVEVSHKNEKKTKHFQLDLAGLYQQKNLLTVLTVIDQLKNDYSLKEENIKAALGNVMGLTGLHGRWEVIHQRPMIVLDVAHNVDGITQLAKQLKNTVYKKLHIVFGIVKDKEIEKVLAILPVNAIYYFTKAQIPRALPEEQLMERAKTYNLKGRAFAEVNKALDAAMAASLEEDLIIVCGSVFVVGEVELPVKND